MIVADTLLLYFSANSTGRVLLLNASEIIFDSFDLSLSGCMPSFDDLHRLCDIVVEGQNFLELVNERRNEVVILLESATAQRHCPFLTVLDTIFFR